MVCDIQYFNCPRRIVIHFAWTLVQWIASLLLERRSAFEDGQHTKTIPGLCLFRNCSLKIGSHFSLITFNSRCLKSNFVYMYACCKKYLIKRLVRGIAVDSIPLWYRERIWVPTLCFHAKVIYSVIPVWKFFLPRCISRHRFLGISAWASSPVLLQLAGTKVHKTDSCRIQTPKKARHFISCSWQL